MYLLSRDTYESKWSHRMIIRQGEWKDEFCNEALPSKPMVAVARM